MKKYAEVAYDEELLRAALSRLADEFRVVVLMFYFRGIFPIVRSPRSWICPSAP